MTVLAYSIHRRSMAPSTYVTREIIQIREYRVGGCAPGVGIDLSNKTDTRAGSYGGGSHQQPSLASPGT